MPQNSNKIFYLYSFKNLLWRLLNKIAVLLTFYFYIKFKKLFSCYFSSEFSCDNRHFLSQVKFIACFYLTNLRLYLLIEINTSS